MKKAFPYLMGLLVLVAMLSLVFGVKRERKLDERMTFNKNDKIPYGTYVAYHELKHIFPEAAISGNIVSPQFWDTSFYDKKTKNALIIITPQFVANKFEMNNLLVFAQEGNDVFISTRQSSITAQDFMKCRSSASFDGFKRMDSVTLLLNNPPFSNAITRSYPGKKFQSYFYKYDTTVTEVLGYNDEKDPVFIHFRTGKGNIYLHIAPIAFTNYFLLHKNNMAYYNEALSVISKDTKKIIWDEFYLYKLFDNSNKDNRGILSVLFKYPPFKWGLLTAIFALCIYVMMEMRRKQRLIPVFNKPKNDSLDFVKTIGRLYYEKNDHRDLAKKMSSYFSEYVRSKYKLSTSNPDDDFIKALCFKSAYNESDLRKIISFIHFLDTAPAISDGQLAEFHKQLEEFYKLA